MLPPDVARRLSDALADGASDAPDLRPQLELEYRRRRYEMVQQLNRSLTQVFRDEYGDFPNRNHELNAWNMLDDLQQAPVKTMDKFASSAVRSVVYKTNTKPSLELFDANWSRLFDRLATLPKGELPEEIDSLVGYGYREQIAAYRILNLALENVILSALDRIIESDREIKYPQRMDHCRNQPLSVVDETSATLIYSIGPDRADQQGRLTYDPTNGTGSAGDIILHVRR